ncbi:hypothetical protein ABZY93_22205 [Streptomyces smyrnaeus]|uniref:hypothetical protein n=1 Tax=Streptomyces smyrnaeus TaxID=1387713 RepID=UPI0033B3EA74
MASWDRITIEIKGHGQYQTTAHDLDQVIAHYLPASVKELRAKIRERTGEGCEGHYDDDTTLLSGGGIGEATHCGESCTDSTRDLQTATECLMILAELDGYATN